MEGREEEGETGTTRAITGPQDPIKVSDAKFSASTLQSGEIEPDPTPAWRHAKSWGIGATRRLQRSMRTVSCYFGARCRNAHCRFGHGEENKPANSVNTRWRRDSGASGAVGAKAADGAKSWSRDAWAETRTCYFGVTCRHIHCRSAYCFLPAALLIISLAFISLSSSPDFLCRALLPPAVLTESIRDYLLTIFWLLQVCTP